MYVSPVYVDVIRWFDENIPGILAALESTEVYQSEETREKEVPSENEQEENGVSDVTSEKINNDKTPEKSSKETTSTPSVQKQEEKTEKTPEISKVSNPNIPKKEVETFNNATVSYVKDVNDKVDDLLHDFSVVKKYLKDKGYLNESILSGMIKERIKTPEGLKKELKRIVKDTEYVFVLLNGL